MSYSFSIPSVTAANPSDLERAVAESIAGLADGPGKDEAATHEAIILAAIPPLAATLDAGMYAVTAAGHRSSDGNSVNISLSVTAIENAPPVSAPDETGNVG